MRAYIINNIRKNARDIFPVEVGSGVFAKSYNRTKIPAVMSLLRNPKKPGEDYPRYPSVLYRDGVITGSNVFRSSTIVNVSRSHLLFTISDYFNRY